MRTASLIPSDSPHMKEKEWVHDRKRMTGGQFYPDMMVTGRPEGLAHQWIYFGLLGNGRWWILSGESPSMAGVHAMWVFDWLLGPKMLDPIPEEVISDKVYSRTFAWVRRFDEYVEELRNKSGAVEDLSRGRGGGQDPFKQLFRGRRSDRSGGSIKGEGGPGG